MSMDMVATATQDIAQAGKLRVALLGNPNTGKTTLFNQLCGLRAKTSNFPGTTTDARIGRWLNARTGLAAEVSDLPGTYGLHLQLPEARICHGVLHGEGPYRRPDAVVVVVDATNLSRNLALVAELLECRIPSVVALNMVDLAQRKGLSLDIERLAGHLGCPVVPIVARSGRGLDDLANALISVQAAELPKSPKPLDGPNTIHQWIDDIVEDSVGGEKAIGAASDSLTDRLDQAFTHPIAGIGVFIAVMSGLFWVVFAFASIPMDLIELIFAGLGGWLSSWLPAGAVHDLLVDGVVAGIAGTVVFLPQICLLFFLISLLEDTGYLARAAFVMDRVLCRFGLPGHAFVPLLSSHACALPGIMCTRLIPDRQDRLATILVAPFMSCSARLPVYVLLTSMLFHDRPALASLAFVGCYLLGASAALLTALLVRRTLLSGHTRPMVLELPSYKRPALRTALLSALHQGRTFLEKAGTVILAICVVMWWLSAYPQTEAPPTAVALEQEAADLRAEGKAGQAEELEQQASFATQKHAQAHSFAGRLGRTVQPVFEPLGYDWQLTIGVLTSFLAREVFVSTMAVLVGGDPESEADDPGVVAKIEQAKRDDGSPMLSKASAASLLVFFVLAMQCLPTLAVTRKEAGLRWAALQFAYMSGLAWILAAITFNGLHWFGVT